MHDPRNHGEKAVVGVGKESCECHRFEDTLGNEVLYVPKSCHHVHTPQKFGFLDGYVKLKRGVHVHITVGGGNFDGHEFCAEFQRLLFHDYLHAWDVHIESPWRESPEGQWYGPVLVPVRQATEDIEGMLLGVLPSVVRLQRLNECLSVSRDVAGRTLGDLVGVLSDGFPDRKSALSTLSGVQVPAVVNERERVDEIVETGAKVVQTIGDYKREAVGDFGQMSKHVLMHLPTMLEFIVPGGVSAGLEDLEDLVAGAIGVVDGPAEPFISCGESFGALVPLPVGNVNDHA